MRTGFSRLLSAFLIVAILVPVVALPAMAQSDRPLAPGPNLRPRPFGPRVFGPWVGIGLGLRLLVTLLVIGVLGIVVWKLLATRPAPAHPDRAVQILRERYARGEISEEDYRSRLALLG